MGAWAPKLIMMAIDGSDQSVRAAEVGAAIARQSGATLHLVTVVRPPEGWWGIVGAPPTAETLGNALSDAQRAVIEKTLGSLDLTDIKHATFEEVGDPANQLAASAEAHEADLLVIGQRGAGVVERLVVGSVADRLVHISKVPIMVIP